MCIWLQLEKDLFANVEGSFCSVSIRLFLKERLGTRQLCTQQVHVCSLVQVVGCRVAGSAALRCGKPPRLASLPYSALKGEQFREA